jgi:hypothetical protein
MNLMMTMRPLQIVWELATDPRKLWLGLMTGSLGRILAIMMTMGLFAPISAERTVASADNLLAVLPKTRFPNAKHWRVYLLF